MCTCTIPSELEEGEAELSVFGYAAGKAVRGTTAPVKLFFHRSSFSEDGTNSVPPTPDLYAQLLEEMDAKIASVQGGADGFSPIATVEQTETGAKITITDSAGTTSAEIQNGADGEAGEAGQDGKSAYEIAVEALAAGLSDSGWVQLEESAFTTGNGIDTENSAVFYRKIGATVNLCGVVKITGSTVATNLATLPSSITPHIGITKKLPFSALGATSGVISCNIVPGSGDVCYLVGPGGISEDIYFNVTYMTDDAPADASSLLAALADLVEVSE